MAVWHAVAIGIKNAGQPAAGLVELPGAVNGAKDFASWAGANNLYKVHLITDENGPVKLSDISSVISDILKNDFPDKLLIYFAGHGAQQNTSTSIWLLSTWDTEIGQAVDVEKTRFNALRSGIPRVAIFADACRNVFGTALTVSGLPIFPPRSAPLNPRNRTQCDLYFASRYDEPAQEVKAEGEVKAFGIFTHTLLNALKGQEKDAIETIPEGVPPKAVTTQHLAKYLLDAVPLESGMISGAAVQLPDLTPVWLDPDRVYNPGPFDGELPVPKKLVLPSTTSVTQHSAVPAKEAIKEVLESWNAEMYAEAQGKVDNAKELASKQLELFTKEVGAVIGRRSFETGSGFTIAGDVPDSAITDRTAISGLNIFEESGAFHIRGGKDDIPHSIAIHLRSGNCIATALLPNFIGAILVIDGAAASLSYSPSAQTRFSQLYSERPYAEAISRWTALMRQGAFPSSPELQANAEEMRKYGHVNPSLGIMAAYAYERIGNLEEIDSMAGYFAMENQPVPFDVAMLSKSNFMKDSKGNLSIETTLPDGSSKVAMVAGSFPLLSRGWVFVDQTDKAISPKLIDLRQHLVRSLWTTLTPAGGSILANLLSKGEL